MLKALFLIENSTPQDVQSAVLAPMFPTFPRPKQHPASTRHSTSSSARTCRASLRPIMPPQAARLDPSDAYCSRNPPPPHLPHLPMRPRSSRERLYPLGLAPPAHSRSQVPPLPSRKPRDASAAAHSPPLSRANPSNRPPSLLARERPALACSPIAARLQSERRGRERACRQPRLDTHAVTCCP